MTKSIVQPLPKSALLILARLTSLTLYHKVSLLDLVMKYTY